MSGFDDGKDASALRTIGEVSGALGIKAHVLRYWEQQFPMLQPLKRSGGRRYYRPADVALIETIDRLVNKQGYTLKGAVAALRAGSEVQAGDQDPAANSGELSHPAGERPGTDNDMTEAVARLKSIRRRLAAIIDE